MKLALLSDVHGNLEALEAVLADLDQRDRDARLICSGDIVGYGPDPEACIAKIRDRRALCVMGNHEEMVLGRRDFSNCVYAGIIAAVWSRSQLTPDSRAFLEGLPASIDASPEVAVCHGDLDSAETYVSTPERAAAAMDQLAARRPKASVLVCGHTHHPMWFTRERGFQRVTSPIEVDLAYPCLVNPGSVGQARDAKPLARYAVLDVERRRISYRDVSYDYAPTLRKLRQAKLVAQVMMPPPTGFRRWIQRWKTKWARFRFQPR